MLARLCANVGDFRLMMLGYSSASFFGMGVGASLFLSTLSIRFFLSDSAGRRPFFHLLRSVLSTVALRASDASEQVHFSVVQRFVYSATALPLPLSEVKSRTSESAASGDSGGEG